MQAQIRRDEASSIPSKLTTPLLNLDTSARHIVSFRKATLIKMQRVHIITDITKLESVLFARHLRDDYIGQRHRHDNSSKL
jgi:hypothetical protein